MAATHYYRKTFIIICSKDFLASRQQYTAQILITVFKHLLKAFLKVGFNNFYNPHAATAYHPIRIIPQYFQNPKSHHSLAPLFSTA